MQARTREGGRKGPVARPVARCACAHHIMHLVQPVAMVLQELPVFDPRAAVSKAVEAPSRLKGAPPGGQSLPSSPDAQAGEGARQGSQATAQTQPAAGQRRALSCVRCQRRKKKCNKKSPCSNCSKVRGVVHATRDAEPARLTRADQRGLRAQHAGAATETQEADAGPDEAAGVVRGAAAALPALASDGTRPGRRRQRGRGKVSASLEAGRSRARGQLGCQGKLCRRRD